MCSTAGDAKRPFCVRVESLERSAVHRQSVNVPLECTFTFKSEAHDGY